MPWKLLADYGTFIFGWLGGYAAFLGPVAGIMICDYFIIRGVFCWLTISICAGESTNTRADSTGTTIHGSWVSRSHSSPTMA
jgi:hypothetical protein